ncbi:MAG: sulfotransferase [Proteobacteria bacterium]|nr:sulfotransferase [Pseudomonadota bacterium]
MLEARQFAQCETAARSVLNEVPENRDVLYLLAVSQRYCGKIADALRTLEQFEPLHPDYGRLFQERGHCLRTVGQIGPAVAAYQQAVMLNPTLSASWQALQGLYTGLGDGENARLAGANVAKLATLPRAVREATNLFSEGQTYTAEEVIRRHLLENPTDIEAMRLLARIGVRLEILDDAEYLLECVLLAHPDYHAARFEYANVLAQRHKFVQALEEAQRLIAIDPGNRSFRTISANAFVGLGRHEQAQAIYRELLEGAPQDADLHLSIGHALKTLGRQTEAITAYRQAASARPDFGDAYWSLANLKTYRFPEEEVARMRLHAQARATAVTDQFHLCFALGKALEDRGDFAESFAFYSRGNELKKSESRYRIETFERSVLRQEEVCTADFFAARRGVGCASPDPIFIVGLPRAGSTLLEQILASHSQVEGTMELAEIPRLALHLSGREGNTQESRYPAVLAEMAPERLRELGEKYLDDTQVLRTSGKPRFIDKMPNNFRHIGLLHLMLPNARIIDARREPMACCFSNFKQLFASGQEFTYSLDDIGRYYRAYLRLMDHWDRVLPGKVLRIQHEAVVADLEGNVRRLLDFCGLEFEGACLEFWKTERNVRTASSEQVRRPIYTEGLQQWRNFEPWLGPLKEALAGATQ